MPTRRSAGGGSAQVSTTAQNISSRKVMDPGHASTEQESFEDLDLSRMIESMMKSVCGAYRLELTSDRPHVPERLHHRQTDPT